MFFNTKRASSWIFLPHHLRLSQNCYNFKIRHFSKIPWGQKKYFYVFFISQRMTFRKELRTLLACGFSRWAEKEPFLLPWTKKNSCQCLKLHNEINLLKKGQQFADKLEHVLIKLISFFTERKQMFWHIHSFLQKTFFN